MRFRYIENSLKLFSFLILTAIIITSCNKEVIKVHGSIKGGEYLDSYLVVKMKSKTSNKEHILDTIDFVLGEFDFYSKSIKPPVKLTFVTADSNEFDIWLGEYGTKTVEGNCQPKIECKVLDSFFCDELERVSAIYNKMYLEPIKDKVEMLATLNFRVENGEELSENEQKLKCELEKALKTAKRLKKKSILKTVRKNPGNPVSMGLMYEEFDNLTSWQKEEALKYMANYFSDTGLNWQIKN